MADPEFGTVMVGVLKVCCVSITIFIIDRFGRKKLMILSLVGKDSTKIFPYHEHLKYRGSHIRVWVLGFSDLQSDWQKLCAIRLDPKVAVLLSRQFLKFRCDTFMCLIPGPSVI